MLIKTIQNWRIPESRATSEHVFMNRRTMYFGGCEMISTDLRYLVTLPEFRAQGMASHLMKSAVDWQLGLLRNLM